jgi:hypothetical protein
MYYLISSTLALVILLIVALYRINRKLLTLIKENKKLNEKINTLNTEITATKEGAVVTNIIIEDNNVLKEVDKTNSTSTPADIDGFKEEVNTQNTNLATKEDESSLTNFTITDYENDIVEEDDENQDTVIPDEIVKFNLELDTEVKDRQQHYYIVKEIVKDRISKDIISSKEYEFVNEDLYKSKTEARLFYDSKIQEKFEDTDDLKEISEYELYIINDIFFDKNYSIDTKTNQEKKYDFTKYLLIDSKGKEQTDGKKFESFVLRNSSKKPYKILESDVQPTTTNDSDNQVTFISTRNSFLYGNYKD